MSANMKLEPGIKALIIGYRHSPENLGKVVTLVKFLRKGEISPNKRPVAGDLWHVEGENLFQVVKGTFTGKFEKPTGGHSFTFVPPKHLLPIRPEEDPLDAKEALESKIEVSA